VMIVDLVHRFAVHPQSGHETRDLGDRRGRKPGSERGAQQATT
jgi:hypothetical protein